MYVCMDDVFFVLLISSSWVLFSFFQIKKNLLLCLNINFVILLFRFQFLSCYTIPVFFLKNLNYKKLKKTFFEVEILAKLKRKKEKMKAKLVEIIL